MSAPDEFQAARRRMLQGQLLARGISSQPVLDAMDRVPRERFVAAAMQHAAYQDRALGIACDQTISQPYIVALMTEALELSSGHRVLEIGTGSGYQTAILAELAGEVVSMERHAALSHQASQVLEELGYRNIRLIVGDGAMGWPPLAPYDRIIVTAAASRVPAALEEQLAEGGRLVIPVGDSERQELQVIRKSATGLETTRLVDCRFVPLVATKAPATEAPPPAAGH